MMGLKKIGFLGIFLMLLDGIMLGVLAGRHGMDLRTLLGSNLDEQTVEQKCLNCGLDLIAIKELIQKAASYHSKNLFPDSAKFSSGEELLGIGGICETLNLLTPEVNRTFLDCLIRQNFPLDSSKKDGRRIWFVNYLASLISPFPTARRYLSDMFSEDVTPVSASSPALAPSSDLNPDSVPSWDSPSALFVPAREPPPPKKIPRPAPNNRPIAQNSQDTSPSNQKNSKDIVIAAITLTAILTAALVALIFFCFVRCQKRNRYYGYQRNDDRPLLSMSLSDITSSSKSFGSPNNILAPPRPLKTNPTQDAHVSYLNSSVKNTTSEVIQENSSLSNEPSNKPTDIPTPKPPPTPPPVMPPPFQKPGPPPPVPPKAGPRPPGPPLPLKGVAPPRPPQGKNNIIRPNKAQTLIPKKPGEDVDADDTNAPKTKLKPFFWDKVQANPDQSMVWDQLKAGSFQFNEEMIESLFGYAEKNQEAKKILPAKDAAPQYVRILDPKKAQNLAISLKAINVKSEEVCNALMEGNELPAEILHTLLKMAPTPEEELKIRLHGDPSLLGPAEKFIKSIVDIPFCYQRMDALLFMASLREEASNTAESFSTIEVACKELRSSRLFLKLLEAVLKTGNRMNNGTYRGDAQAFKLDTLLKLADVRGTDGKTTLLHFVVLEIIRAEGLRSIRTGRESRSSISSLVSEELFEDPPVESEDHCRELGLKVVSGLSGELENVKKAAALDADALTRTVASLGERLLRTKEFLEMKMEGINEESQFVRSLRGFVERGEGDITCLLEEERRIRSLVKNTSDYFHGSSGKDEGLRLFVVVGEFLSMIDKVCREVKLLPKPGLRTRGSRETVMVSPARDPRQLVFPAIKDRRMGSSSSSSSDDEDG